MAILPIAEKTVHFALIHIHIAEATEQLVPRGDVPFQSELPEDTVETLSSVHSLLKGGFTVQLKDIVAAVWSDSGVQAYAQREEFELSI